MNHPARILCAAAATAACIALPARADNEGVDQGLANMNLIIAARQACTEAARTGGLDVRKAERVTMKENAPVIVRLETGSRGNVDCEYDAASKTATLPGVFGLPAPGKDAERSPLVKVCEKVAEQQDIRIGEFDQIKPLDGRRVEVRFDRPFFGQRHTCLVDQAKNLVSFDGGKTVPLPATVDAKKK